MKRIKELQEQRKKLLDEAKAILAGAEKRTGDDAGMTDDESKKFDDLRAKADEIQGEIDKIKAEEERKQWLADQATADDKPENRQTRPDTPSGEPQRRETVTAKPYSGQLRAFKPRQGESRTDAEARAYRSGQWLRGFIFGIDESRQWCRENGLEARALNLSSNTAGGYLVPEELSSAIIDLREERGVFRREATVIPMATETLLVPRRTAGVTAYAVGENPSSGVTASEPTVDQIELNARQWAALTRYSKALADDAIISVSEMIAREMAYAFADKEDEAGFNGDGTSTYHGIQGLFPKVDDGNHAGSLYTAASGNTAFSTLDLADFEGVIGQLPMYALRNASWYVSQVGWAASMQRLLDAGGGNTITTLADGSVGRQFLGFPVVISQVLNAVTTAQTDTVILAFGDLSQTAHVGDRTGFGILPLQERYAEFLQIGVIGSARWDINVHELGDANNAGSMIGLKTPGS